MKIIFETEEVERVDKINRNSCNMKSARVWILPIMTVPSDQRSD